MSSVAVETRGLGRRFGARWALRDCSLSLPSGGVIGLVGPNGAGKTTLLRLAAGALSASAGEIEVLGRTVPDRPESLAEVGFVAQHKPLYSSFTVAEMLRFGAELNPRWEGERAIRHLSDLEIGLREKVGKLSGGQRAQVALALALGKRPRLLLLDEPVANLDPLARRQFFGGLMQEVDETDVTVVLSSHLLEDLDRSCDYLVLLSASRVQLSGHTEDLLAGHRWLSGPADRAPSIAAQHAIVQHAVAGRLARLLIRANGPVHDPAWSSRAPTLEELVLAYMDRPDIASVERRALATVST